MADTFLQLSFAERREVLRNAAEFSERSAQLLEKDVWVVKIIDTLFRSVVGEHLVFKGGTSLSKAYGVIKRFSEDVDVTLDIRVIAPDQVGDNDEALPRSRSHEKKLTKIVRGRLYEWVAEIVKPMISEALASEGLAVSIRAEHEKLYIDYEATWLGLEYVSPCVLLDFGARSTGEPAKLMGIKCDLSDLVKDILFPTAMPRVMLAVRTCWEKVLALHVFCLKEMFRNDRIARHFHDVMRLDEAGIADKAFADRELANAVARHQSMFFVEKAADRSPIDYMAAVNGGLQLVPGINASKILREDYDQMVESKMLLNDYVPFETIMASCADIAERANRAAAELSGRT